jgi:hypothetical protein
MDENVNAATQGVAGPLGKAGESYRHPRRRVGMLRRPRVRLTAVVALAVAAGVMAWVVVDSTGGSSRPSTSNTPSQRVVATLSPLGLRALSAAVKHPIYWVGENPGYTYEVTQTPNGNIYVRYLPPGVKINDSRPNFLIIGTYPFKGSFSALKRGAHGKPLSVAGGGIAVVDPAYPKSVHLSWPGVNFQVEVYDPSPQRSLSIALSGEIRPVG